MKKSWLGIGAALIVIAFLVGFLPQYRQLTASRETTATLQTRLDAAEARLRLVDVLGHQLRLSEAVQARNYGEAAALSSAYFDAVRQEASRAGGDTSAVLSSILASRDQVTAAIAGTDPNLELTLREQQRQLRRALGYPTGGTS